MTTNFYVLLNHLLLPSARNFAVSKSSRQCYGNLARSYHAPPMERATDDGEVDAHDHVDKSILGSLSAVQPTTGKWHEVQLQTS